jgi:hypothetical protein
MASNESRGAIGPELDTLQRLSMLGGSLGGPDKLAKETVRMALELFGASDTPRERRGNPLVIEVQSPTPVTDRDWEQLDKPSNLINSLTQISYRVKNR